jgi:hypothetical protein
MDWEAWQDPSFYHGAAKQAKLAQDIADAVGIKKQKVEQLAPVIAEKLKPSIARPTFKARGYFRNYYRRRYYRRRHYIRDYPSYCK